MANKTTTSSKRASKYGWRGFTYPNDVLAAVDFDDLLNDFEELKENFEALGALLDLYVRWAEASLEPKMLQKFLADVSLPDRVSKEQLSITFNRDQALLLKTQPTKKDGKFVSPNPFSRVKLVA